MAKSRKLVTLLALACAQAAWAQTEPLLARYDMLTSVAVRRCSRPADTREIVVCGRRTVDRYRVPIVVLESGDPRREGVWSERERISRAPPLPCGVDAFFGRSNCGMVGVSVSTKFDGTLPRLRTPAD